MQPPRMVVVGNTERKVKGPLCLLADMLCSVPAQADERYFHEDLPRLGGRDLRRERQRLRFGLWLNPKQPGWAAVRLARVEAELSQRGGDVA